MIRPAKVLIVDDSAIVRHLLATGLANDPKIQVVGQAADAFIARDMLLKHEPDVITLDIEMPRVDGLSFLKKIMEHRPTATIIVSSISQQGSAASLEALRLGAAAVFAKPGGPQAVGELVEALKRCIGELRMGGFKLRRPTQPVMAAPIAASAVTRFSGRSQNALIAIGASTGGTQAIESLLTRLPAGLPPIVITQHMPAGFTQRFADRLNDITGHRVVEASQGDLLRPGCVYVAPGGRHMVVERNGIELRVGLNDGAPVHFQRPAVDVLFRSVAKLRSQASVGIVLTGMGQDGADGLLEMKQAGSITLAEDEQSCVVFGMPKEAIARGGVTDVVTLWQMPQALVAALERLAAPSRARTA
ncbi:MAG: chemotaxis response regulator protein-glutamate methylesterase [Acidobacteria bacterium]|nr:chemotaxis response regulator protein-glutamate methylesterase [Acidobacteriota bacterium]